MKKVISVLLSLIMLMGLLPFSLGLSAEETGPITIDDDNYTFFGADFDADGKLYYSGYGTYGKNGLGYTTAGFLKNSTGKEYGKYDSSAYLFSDEIDNENMWKIDFNTKEDGTHAKSSGGGTYIFPFYSNLKDSSGNALPNADVETLGDNIANADDFTHLAVRLRLVDDGTGRAVEGATHSVSLNLLAAAAGDSNYGGWSKSQTVYLYDINKGEKTIVTKAAMDIPLGFDGYVIYPQNNVMLKKNSNTVTTFSELVNLHILVHWNCSHTDTKKATDNWVGTEFYIGDMILTKNIDSFNLEYGAPVFEATANDTAVTVISDDSNAVYSFNKNSEDWLSISEFNEFAKGLERNTTYTVYAKYPKGKKIVSRSVKTTNTGIMWKLLDVPKEESFYNYKNKYIGWMSQLSMKSGIDPLLQDATYEAGGGSGVYTREDNGEYFVILNPQEVFDANGKLKEANGGLYWNTLSGRGLAADGNAITGIPEGIAANNTKYLAMRFKVTSDDPNQYSSVSLRLYDASFINLTNSILIDKATGTVKLSSYSNHLLKITGGFDGWILIPYSTLSYSQRSHIQKSGNGVQFYFHTEACGSAHGTDTSSDWQNKILWIGDIVLVDDYDLYVKNCINPPVATEGLIFTAEDLYEAKGTYDVMPNTFEASIKLSENYTPYYKGIIFGNTGYKQKNFSFEITIDGNPSLYAKNNSTVYNKIFDKVDVRTGEFVHIAIVNNLEANTVTCYINGVAMQTIAGAIPEIVSEVAGVLGGDYRTGNKCYFGGEIRSVALYSEARTEEQIIGDVNNLGAGTPLSAWDLTKEAVDGKIADLSGNGHEIKLGSVWFKNKEPLDEFDYSFAVVGDTQILNYYHKDKYLGIYDWLVENKDEKKIEYVLELGDITDKNYEREWTAALEAHAKLDGVLPYSLVIGNHDVTAQFNNAFNSTPYATSFDGQYKSGDLRNTYREIRVGEVNYLIFALEIGPSDEVLNWAGEIIDAHPHHNAIITTHVYLDNNGSPISPSSSLNPVNCGGSNQAADIWEKFISKHSNIVLTLCGHISHSAPVVTRREGDSGNIVTEILIDPQGIDLSDEPTGMVTMLYFSENGSKVQVETISTVRDEYYMECGQYELELPVTESCTLEFKETVAPTCTEQGYDVYVCTECGNTYKKNFVETIAHSFIELSRKEPTVDAVGYIETGCENCDYYEFKELAPIVPEYILGDIDGDSKIDGSDLAMLRRIVLKTLDEVETADVNYDKVIDVRDIVSLKRKLVS